MYNVRIYCFTHVIVYTHIYIYHIAEIFGGGLYLTNWWFCFDTTKIKPVESVRVIYRMMLFRSNRQIYSRHTPFVGKSPNILIPKLSLQLYCRSAGVDVWSTHRVFLCLQWREDERQSSSSLCRHFSLGTQTLQDRHVVVGASESLQWSSVHCVRHRSLAHIVELVGL